MRTDFHEGNSIDTHDNPDSTDRPHERWREVPYEFTGLAIDGLAFDSLGITDEVEADADRSRSDDASSSWPLNESELDYLAEARGWEKISDLPAQPPMASYRRNDGTRLFFWLSTGTVGSYRDHPRQGRTQLFRRKISMSEAREVFDNPRTHTGAGYHRREEQPRRNGKHRGNQGRNNGWRRPAPCRYGNACTRSDCWFEHPVGGGGGRVGGGRGGRGPCRYGSHCYRPDCWFDHPWD